LLIQEICETNKKSQLKSEDKELWIWLNFPWNVINFSFHWKMKWAFWLFDGFGEKLDNWISVFFCCSSWIFNFNFNLKICYRFELDGTWKRES
jgi:hypothetical protein